MTEYTDHPFYEVVAKADELIAAGATVWFKFTCANCGSRQTFDVPNTAYKSGRCEECDHVTNVEEQGMNYLLHFGQLPPGLSPTKGAT